MKNVSIKYFLILLFLGTSFNGEGQSFPDNLDIGMLQSGYKERVSGETASYHSSNPDVNNALVARNSSNNNTISWETANIPADYKGKYIYFVWLAGLATGKNRQNSSYDLYINNKKAFNINPHCA